MHLKKTKLQNIHKRICCTVLLCSVSFLDVDCLENQSRNRFEILILYNSPRKIHTGS